MPGKGDLSDPTWQHNLDSPRPREKSCASKRSCMEGRQLLYSGRCCPRARNYTRKGKKIWDVGDGGPTLKTDNPRNIALADADHYLQTRSVTAALSIVGYGVMALDNSAYDKIKSVVQAMQAAGNVSMPTLVSDPTDPGSLYPMRRRWRYLFAHFSLLQSEPSEIGARNLCGRIQTFRCPRPPRKASIGEILATPMD